MNWADAAASTAGAYTYLRSYVYICTHRETVCIHRETAWKAIGNTILKPCYLRRSDHNRKIRTRKQRTDVGKYSFVNTQSDNYIMRILTKIEVPSMMQCMPSMCPDFICNLATLQRPTLSMTGNTAPCCAGSERMWSQ